MFFFFLRILSLFFLVILQNVIFLVFQGRVVFLVLMRYVQGLSGVLECFFGGFNGYLSSILFKVCYLFVWFSKFVPCVSLRFS